MNTTAPASIPAELDERIQRAFASLTDQAFDLLGVAECNEFHFVFINPAGLRLLALPPDTDVTPLLLTDFVAAQFLPTLLYEAAPAALRGDTWHGETVLRRHDRRECPVHFSIAGLPASDTQAECIVFAATDITGSREIRASLQQEQVLLRALLDNVPDSIYFKDLQSRFIRVSANLARKQGVRAPEEVVGKTDFDYFAAEHARKAYADEQQIIQSGRPVIDIEEKETWPDGHVTWASTSKMPLQDARGRIVGTFGISRDITARKETEQKLQVAQKELLEASRLAGMAEIASGVLHNIGNALNSVNTSAALLNDQLARSRLANLGKATQLLQENGANLGAFLTADPRGRQVPAYLVQLAGILTTERETFERELGTLRKSIEHIVEIVAMQQNYARVSALVEDAAPAELIEEALHISAMSLSRHGINVERDFAVVPRVRVTRHKVLQILVNLIRNAKYAMDETGRGDKTMIISLRLGAPGRVEIAVRDNGTGIAPQNLTRIFGFGFTTRKDGHGFGLHSSANAARELGGALRAESEGPGKGAVFTLDVPVAVEPAGAGA